MKRDAPDKADNPDEPGYAGEVDYKILPHDDVIDRLRYSLRFTHEGSLPYGMYAQAHVLRVSDDDYWKDFPDDLKTTTERLLQTDQGQEQDPDHGCAPLRRVSRAAISR